MPRVCIHLDQETAWEYARYFSRIGLDYALVCLTCREHPDGIEASLREVSPERFAQIDEGGSWDGDKNAIVGRPQLLERPSGLSLRLEDIALAGQVPASIVGLQPIPYSDRGEFVVLAGDGDLFRVNPGDGSV